MKDPAIMRIIHKCEDTKRQIEKEHPYTVLRHRCANLDCKKTLKTSDVYKGHTICGVCRNRARTLKNNRKYAILRTAQVGMHL